MLKLFITSLTSNRQNRILSIMDSNDIITAAHYLAMEESVSPDSTVCSKYGPVGLAPPESPPTADLRFYDFSCRRADGASAGIGAGRGLAIRSAIFPESLFLKTFSTRQTCNHTISTYGVTSFLSKSRPSAFSHQSHETPYSGRCGCGPQHPQARCARPCGNGTPIRGRIPSVKHHHGRCT